MQVSVGWFLPKQQKSSMFRSSGCKVNLAERADMELVTLELD